VAQLPGGASIARTPDVVLKAEQILAQEKSISDYTSITGFNFIDSYSQPNSAFIVVTLKPFEERQAKSESANAIIARLNGKLGS
jgi:multidrug efflux pump subunit AcrB